MLNQTRRDLGIADESPIQRFGISPDFTAPLGASFELKNTAKSMMAIWFGSKVHVLNARQAQS
jgi:hypothetical protein